jgi:aspartokinase-like uncharacterized kinase
VIVVKVGGSLYDHPRLGPGLRAYLAELDEPVLLVPGGGDFADAVRKLDAVHRLGEEAAHWLALRALAAAADFLRALVSSPRLTVLDCHAFAVEDESRPGRLPHSWRVTSDSVAAHAAVVFGASRLVLLKSTDVPPGTPWPEAAARGWVDPHFPAIVADHALRVEAVNFRARLNAPG